MDVLPSLPCFVMLGLLSVSWQLVSQTFSLMCCYLSNMLFLIFILLIVFNKFAIENLTTTNATLVKSLT